MRSPCTVLLTGASGGIGLELARLFASDGHSLILLARRGPELQQLASELQHEYGVQVHILPKDLSCSQSPAEVMDFLKERNLTVDILVNNAGFACHGKFAESHLQTQLDLLQLNITSLTHLTRLLIPPMLSRHLGKILNVASLGAYLPGPLLATYFASKAYVLSFSEALSDELAGSGVSVTCLCPGPTRTNFASRTGVTETRAFARSVMSPDCVAREAYRALWADKSVHIAGLRNRLQMLPARLLPRRVLASISRKFHELPSAGTKTIETVNSLRSDPHPAASVQSRD